jgi:relaxase-like protein
MAPVAILSVKYLAAPSAASARRAVGGFVRYIQYRDHHQDLGRETSRLVGYVGHRDRTSRRGQLFDRAGFCGDLGRKALTAHVRRSLRDLPRGARPQRAVYRFVLSPANAQGLDLRELARATMRSLEKDAGPLPPWVAAVHRNTQHPHVHIVMAARREIAEDRFRAVMVTRPRLARMKESLAFEMARQLGRPAGPRGRGGLAELARIRQDEPISHVTRVRGRRRPRDMRADTVHELSSRLRRAAGNYRRQMERELEDEHRRSREGGWER